MQLRLNEFLLSPDSNLDDSVVRRQFRSRASDAITSTIISVKQDARKRLIDIGVARKLERGEELERTAVFGNKTERLQASGELFGRTDKLGNVVSLGIFDQLAADGYITRQKALSLTQEAKETIDEIDIEQRLLAADRANDPEKAREVYRQILDPKFLKILILKPNKIY